MRELAGKSERSNSCFNWGHILKEYVREPPRLSFSLFLCVGCSVGLCRLGMRAKMRKYVSSDGLAVCCICQF